MPADDGAERRRLDDPAWRRFGPYVSERSWGTVREDYSAGGDAWSFFPHDHARSRTYRWNEDGLCGICDENQRICLAFAFWNGQDPFLKERIFGLTGEQGNHGEDAKEYWWYLDSTPTHSWMRWRYLYPQAAFPYDDLVSENARRTRTDPEYELRDTGVLAGDRYWEITAEFAKAAPDDICIRMTVRNAGPQQATLHVLPTLWFRNRWRWTPGVPTPEITAGPEAGGLLASEELLGTLALTGDGDPESLFCENETNTARLYRQPDSPPYPKDGINDHVVGGAATVNPARRGTKAALWYELTVPAGGSREIRLRLAPEARATGEEWGAVHAARRAEADEFYAGLAPGATDAEQRLMRHAFAGMLWGKQFYHYDVARWLDGDPGEPVPPPQRKSGRNARWRHVLTHDVISMPDKWEYPWFAAWDLAFHCVTLAHVDPAFAKEQLRLITREWYTHPDGQLPAYEWNFGDVNPPVHAIAALAVFELDGGRDRIWLERIFHKLLLSFTWWANVKDPGGANLFGGGFLGMDNVGPFDRSAPLPDGLELEQADGTGWMALFCLSMLEIALVLASEDHAYEDIATKFFQHFTLIAGAINDRGLWDEADGFYYDTIRRPDGSTFPVRTRSMTGLIPFCAVARAEGSTLAPLDAFRTGVDLMLATRPEYRPAVTRGEGWGSGAGSGAGASGEGDDGGGDDGGMLLSLAGHDRLPRILERLADPEEFLSPHGLRSLSAAYRSRPFEVWLSGELTASVDYEPAESTTPLFGGNSNWRGPVWFPVNYLVIGALQRYGRQLGDTYTVEFPRGSGERLTLGAVADNLAARLVALYLPAANGCWPAEPDRGGSSGVDPAGGPPLFYEYFDGDTGAGLGASHQTGWTGLVADMVIRVAAARTRREEPA